MYKSTIIWELKPQSWNDNQPLCADFKLVFIRTGGWVVNTNMNFPTQGHIYYETFLCLERCKVNLNMIVVSVYYNIGTISLPDAINWITEWWYWICRWWWWWWWLSSSPCVRVVPKACSGHIRMLLICPIFVGNQHLHPINLYIRACQTIQHMLFLARCLCQLFFWSVIPFHMSNICSSFQILLWLISSHMVLSVSHLRNFISAVALHLSLLC